MGEVTCTALPLLSPLDTGWVSPHPTPTPVAEVLGYFSFVITSVPNTE